MKTKGATVMRKFAELAADAADYRDALLDNGFRRAEAVLLVAAFIENAQRLSAALGEQQETR